MDNIWLLQIDHKHGTDAYVHRTEAGARKRLADYVNTSWPEVLTIPKPDDDEEAITLYFEKRGQWLGDESYTLDEIEVED